MQERVVVLGSNSFSGSNAIDGLLDAGFKVVGISRSPEYDPIFLKYKKKESPEFKFFQLDLNRDLESIMEIIREFCPEYVINFAAQGMVAESWRKPEDWFNTNLVSAVKLHERLRKCDFLKKFVQVSTPEVYGACEGSVKENVFYKPSTPYAVSKAAADMSLMTFFKVYDFPVIFTRAANVYGPGQQLYRIAPRTIFYFLTGRKLQLHGGGHSRRSFIHIRDVVDGTIKAAQNAEPGEIFHFSTGRDITIRELVKTIADRMGVSFEDNVETEEDRPGKDSAYILDSSKAKEQLGWESSIELEDGIDQTIQWVKENLETLKKLPQNYIHKT